VPGDDEGLAPPQSVGHAARDDLEDGRHRLREPLDDAEERGSARRVPVRNAGSRG